MIQSLGLKNFKSFQSLAPQNLGMLTLLCGNNSCGKSTLLQSILLLKQSLQQRDASALSFNGDLVRLGNYGHVVSGQNSTNKIQYNIGPTGEAIESVALSYKCGSGKRVALSTIEAQYPAGRTLRLTFRIDGKLNNIGIAYSETDNPQASFRHPPIKVRVRPYLHPFGDFESALERFDVSGLQGAESSPKGRAHECLKTLVEYLDVLEQWLLEGIRYVGPIRQAPERYYVVEQVPTIGPSGENTVPVMRKFRNKKVRLIKPGGSKRIEDELEDAVGIWMKHFGFGYKLSSLDELGVMYQLGLKLPNFGRDKKIALPDVGYGFSQLLPIVVQGLLATKGEMVMLEQPEIHLHPAVQSKLGDFLCMLARKGVRVIVETHSEHLLNRLRLNAAKDDSGKLRNLIRIFFVEQPGGGWQSGIRELELDEYGGIVDWPAGFFDSTESEIRELTNVAMRRMRKQAFK